MLERRTLLQSNTERISVGVLLIGLCGLVGRAIIRFALFLGDSIFRVFWRRNDSFVKAAQAETFRAQMEELAAVPAKIDEISKSQETQTRILEQLLSGAETHGLDIAELKTAMNFVAPGAIRLRRQFARRSTDPRPSDPAVRQALERSEPPDQSEDVAGYDEP